MTGWDRDYLEYERDYLDLFHSTMQKEQERNIEFLNRLRIIYKRDPITDKPSHETEHYRFYEDGTYQCYQLFKSKAKINTYKSLKWHILVIWYLNPHLSKSQLRKIAIHLSRGFPQ